MPSTSGLQLPALSEADQAYLDEAKSTAEFMQRVTKVARRLDNERQQESARVGRQTPDTYIQSLSKLRDTEPVADQASPSAEFEPTPPQDGPIPGTPEYERMIRETRREKFGIQDGDDMPEMGRDLNDLDDLKIPMDDESVAEREMRVKEMQSVLKKAAEEEGETLPVEDEKSTAEVKKQIEEVQAALRAAAGVTEADLEAGNEGPEEEDEVLEVKRQVEEVQDGMRKVARVTDADFEESRKLGEDSVAGVTRRIEEVQAALRKAGGLDRVETPEAQDVRASTVEKDVRESKEEKVGETREEKGEVAEVTGEKPEVVDRQIEFVEGYLEKLKREEREERLKEERKAAAAKVTEQVQKLEDEKARFEGLDGTGGEMSVEEKKAAFEAIRQQALKHGAGGGRFADPLGVELPQEPEGDVEEVGDLVGEIEEEVQRYLGEARRVLEEHGKNMKLLLAKLRLGE